jgi:hypothetical protein
VRANTSAGPGNFHMRPNGVFYVTGEVAGILVTPLFIKQRPQADFANQSGPMLVINGKLHSRFVRYGGSRKYRAGVGSATLTLSCLPYRNQKFRLASSRVSSAISFSARTLCFWMAAARPAFILPRWGGIATSCRWAPSLAYTDKKSHETGVALPPKADCPLSANSKHRQWVLHRLRALRRPS